jgi:transposase
MSWLTSDIPPLLTQHKVFEGQINNAQSRLARGLDPRDFKSGTSVDKRARLSKAGNAYTRFALYLPALSAKTHDPYVKGFFEHLA